jgi:predicted DNA-binding transcriptional regulator AlpA
VTKKPSKSIASDEAPRTPPFEFDPSDERLLGKQEVCAMANMSFVTIWKLMRAKKFPRARDLGGGKVSWLRSEILFWMKNRPFRKYDGDVDGVPRDHVRPQQEERHHQRRQQDHVQYLPIADDQGLQECHR